MTASAHRAVQRLPERRAPTPAALGRPGPDDAVPLGGMVIPAADIAAFGGGDAETGRRELRSMLATYRDRKLRMPPTPKPVSVRWAEPKDEDAAVALWKIDIAENAEAVAPLDEARLRDWIKRGTERRFGYVGLIDGDDGPIALSVLVAAQWHWSNQWYVQDLCTFVHPDHRKSRHVHELLDFNEWIVDEMSRLSGYRTYLLTGVLGTKRLWAKAALFRRRYATVGSSFIYPPVGTVT
jgi:hypothetical protein